MQKFKALCSLALMVPVLLFAGTSALAEEKLETLRFGLLPAEEAVEMVRQFQGIADHVSGEVGLPNKIFVSQSYNALIEAMEAGKIDIALPAIFLQLGHYFNIELINHMNLTDLYPDISIQYYYKIYKFSTIIR